MQQHKPPTRLEEYSSEYVDTFLRNYAGLIQNAEFYASLDPPMDEGERMDAQMAFMQYWGQRHLLGDLYRAARLTPEQTERLAELDRQVLAHAAAMEIAYGPTLLSLVQDLFAWGTPLAEQSGPVRIETTITTLVELVANADHTNESPSAFPEFPECS